MPGTEPARRSPISMWCCPGLAVERPGRRLRRAGATRPARPVRPVPERVAALAPARPPAPLALARSGDRRSAGRTARRPRRTDRTRHRGDRPADPPDRGEPRPHRQLRRPVPVRRRSCARSPSVNTNSASTRSPRDIPKPIATSAGAAAGWNPYRQHTRAPQSLLKGSSTAGRARCITRSRPSGVLRPYLPGFRRFTLEFMTQTRQEPDDELKSDVVG